MYIISLVFKNKFPSSPLRPGAHHSPDFAHIGAERLRRVHHPGCRWFWRWAGGGGVTTWI